MAETSAGLIAFSPASPVGGTGEMFAFIIDPDRKLNELLKY